MGCAPSRAAAGRPRLRRDRRRGHGAYDPRGRRLLGDRGGRRGPDLTTVLLTDAGRRVDVVEAFRRKGAWMVAVDSDPLAPALYRADERGVIPRAGEEGWLE